MSLIRTCLYGLIFVAFSQPVNAQYQWAGVYDIVRSLCAEWHFEYRELNGLRVAENTLSAISTGNVIFFENHTYLLKQQDSILESGVWDYNVFRERIELKDDPNGNLRAVIQHIAPDRMVLVPIVQSGGSQKVFERLRYYYRRL